MRKHFSNSVRRFLREEHGANGVEYALLAGLIAIAFVAGAGFLGTTLNGFFNYVGNCINNPSTAACGSP